MAYAKVHAEDAHLAKKNLDDAISHIKVSNSDAKLQNMICEEMKKHKGNLATSAIESTIANNVNKAMYGCKNLDQHIAMKTLDNTIAYTIHNKPYDQLSYDEIFHVHNIIKYGGSSYSVCGVEGCIHGSCLVTRLNSNNVVEKIPLQTIKKGNRILTDMGFKEVVYIVKSKITPNTVMYSLDKKCILTHGHPIWVQDKGWHPVQTALDVQEVYLEQTEWVYDVVIPGAQCVDVGGTWCITLGHGVQDGIAKHDVLGNLDYVLAMMKTIYKPSIDSDGPVPVRFIRDVQTSWIMGLERDTVY